MVGYELIIAIFFIGMEALETSINYWEDALAAFSLGARGGVSGTLALTSPEEAEFCREIQELLQNAYLLQVSSSYKLLISRHINSLLQSNVRHSVNFINLT